MADDKEEMELLKNLINFGMAVRGCHCRGCVGIVVDEIRGNFDQFSEIEIMGFTNRDEPPHSEGGTIH